MIQSLMGKLHLLLLHLPIGILLLAVGLEWACHWKAKAISNDVKVFAYGIGAISALLASVSGYLLSTNGNYNAEEINYHKWAGIFTALFSIVLYFSARYYNLKIQRWLALFLALTIGLTGHLGGTITHGEGFLTNFRSDSQVQKGPIFNVESVQEAKVFEDLIRPIIAAKCVPCHGPDKIKGKLRLDSQEYIIKGGKSGNALIHQSLQQSELISRITLPLSDDKHMPPRKKMQMSEEEIELMHWWMTNGASFQHSVTDIDTSLKIETLINNIIKNASSEIPDMSTIAAFTPETELPLPDEKIIQDLKDLGVVALSAGDDSPFLEVNFVNVKELKSEHLEQLSNLSPHITRLQMSGLDLSDNNLTVLLGMKNLVKLVLNDTQVTDEAMKFLANLKNLRSLNLNNTSISDSGIKSLEALEYLEKIYVFNTSVQLDSLSNGAQIIKGGFQLDNLASDTIRLTER